MLGASLEQILDNGILHIPFWAKYIAQLFCQNQADFGQNRYNIVTLYFNDYMIQIN